ncbi:MAG TPA: NAD+ synthase, partial [Chitinophagaceae bacterium]|nr:NAD+ synthase [Chitinophagaceae bacterium]
MKIILAQQNYHIGNFEGNRVKIVSAIQEAVKKKADLIVFSELAVCGYPPRDFLEFSDFIRSCHESLQTIAGYSREIGILIGCPTINPLKEGKDLFNSVYLLHDGRIGDVIHKTLLPTYDVFDEYRYFEPAAEWHVMEFKGYKLAVTVCEDIWNLGDNPLYRICPMDKLKQQSPDIMINLSASPFDYRHSVHRLDVIRANVRKYQLPLLYCNTVGSQTEIVFDGASIACNPDGTLVALAESFREQLLEVTWKDGSLFSEEQSSIGTENENVDQNFDPEYQTASIYHALILGIRDYFSKMGFRKAILGSSGGIDSALTQVLATEALGADQVTAVLLPSAFSSTHSVDDAIQLSKNLGNPFYQISIEPVFQSLLNQLKPVFGNLPFSLAEENLQSRSRGNLLMGIANKLNFILLNTSNKSECATGYGTLYGDMAGGISVLGDVYKTQVYALARYVNREKERIPLSILEKAPSAELRPGQKDSDSLPPYPVLDTILYQYIEQRKGPSEITAMGYERSLVDRILKLVNNSEYKRNQFCPVIRVSPKSFGVGRRIPI